MQPVETQPHDETEKPMWLNIKKIGHGFSFALLTQKTTFSFSFNPLESFHQNQG